MWRDFNFLQWTDRQTQQNRLLNPASRMRARGNDEILISYKKYGVVVDTFTSSGSGTGSDCRDYPDSLSLLQVSYCSSTACISLGTRLPTQRSLLVPRLGLYRLD